MMNFACIQFTSVLFNIPNYHAFHLCALKLRLNVYHCKQGKSAVYGCLVLGSCLAVVRPLVEVAVMMSM